MPNVDLVEALRGLWRRGQKSVPRLTNPDPEQRHTFMYEFREYQTSAGADSVPVLTCITLDVLADVCLLAICPADGIRSIADVDLLECRHTVAKPGSCPNAIYIKALLQQAASKVPPPKIATDAHKNVYDVRREMCGEVTAPNCWSHFTARCAPDPTTRSCGAPGRAP